ncbi:hypothetical protein AB0D66_33365 [Streptomyces sp. NPDC048270]|uniref:hypothetical protein n=1 Tax=Streptomyces sp. NPDC048270 TaxID=3154615 RepID=UPI0033E28EBB
MSDFAIGYEAFGRKWGAPPVCCRIFMHDSLYGELGEHWQGWLEYLFDSNNEDSVRQAFHLYLTFGSRALFESLRQESISNAHIKAMNVGQFADFSVRRAPRIEGLEDLYATHYSGDVNKLSRLFKEVAKVRITKMGKSLQHRNGKLFLSIDDSEYIPYVEGVLGSITAKTLVWANDNHA